MLKFLELNQMFRKNCLICNDINIIDIMDLGMHPFADTFISKSKEIPQESVWGQICQASTVQPHWKEGT